MLATITVTSTGDTIASDASVTLREAITAIDLGANTSDVTAVGTYGTNDTINFSISGAGVKTISPASALPTITKPVTINGYSQGGSANTLANTDNAVLLIELNGTNAGAGVSGLTLGAGSGGSQIEGLVINRFAGNGVVIQSNGNFIVGSFIGVDTGGSAREPNGTFPTTGDGVMIQNASNNTIGGTTPAARNVISGNAIDGVHIVGTLASPATGNTLVGNFIGVAADGTDNVGNRTEPAPAPGSVEGNNLFGVDISGGNNNTVGGTVAGSRNVIGYNSTGITIDNGGQGNSIQGNFVGVGADGVTSAANLLHGVDLRSSNGFSAPLGPAQPNEPGTSNNTIGGTVAGAGNLIEFNGSAGVAVFGNPVSVSGQPNVGNAIEGNSIFENSRTITDGVGIDLSNGFAYPKDDGSSHNDVRGHGAPNDPNNFQNFPVLTSAISGGSSTINGTLHEAANTTYRVEFFTNDTDPMGLQAEGQIFLGFENVTTDGSGDVTFSAPLSGPIGHEVTATAIDPTGNTSEFSASIIVPPPTFVVTNTQDTGTGSLRQAIMDANASGGASNITFDIPGNGPFVIAPATNLPNIAHGVIIDGTTQPGFDSSTHVPVVVLDGKGGATDGFIFLNSADHSTVKGLEVTNFTDIGIYDTGAPNITITGNYIGTDGVNALSNKIGIRLESTADSTVGGVTFDTLNLIGGNGVGLKIDNSSINNHVLGNYIGTNPNGASQLGNDVGIDFEVSAGGNFIGGTAAGAGNLISNNKVVGISIDNSIGNVIQGNYIGTDVTGTQPLGNGVGVSLDGTSVFTVIGGIVPGAGNLISANDVGILINNSDASTVQGNRIGTDAVGSADLGNNKNVVVQSGTDNLIGGSSAAAANIIGFSKTVGVDIQSGLRTTVRLNSIFGSGAKGISLNNSGTIPLPNDLLDGDNGANNSQNFPVLTSAASTATSTTISGLLNSTANTQFVIDLYSNPASDDSGHGEGQTYLGSVGVTTDAFGNASFTTTFQTPVAAGSVVTATATTLDSAPHGDTSEFAADIDVTGPALPPPPPPTPPALSINDVSHNEQNSGTHTFTFTVTRSGDTSGTSDVFYSTSDVSATAGSDYTAIPLTALHFAANQTTATIVVNEQGDTTVEGDETFTVNLSNPTNATISDGTGIGTIVNDDVAPPPPASGSVSLVTDPCDSTKTAVQIYGTDNKDTITVTKSGSSQGKAVVKINGANKGTFSFSGSIVVYGKGGADNISIDSAITRSAYVWGGDGNDTVSGGGGNDIIFGQGNDDSINGNAGRDILVGGDGTDKLNGGSGDDLLIAGDFKSAPSMSQLCSIQKEWTRTDKNYAARVKDLTNGGGFNSIKLNSSTLFSSTSLKDSMTGGADSDLFFAAMSGDKITDKGPSETVVNIG